MNRVVHIGKKWLEDYTAKTTLCNKSIYTEQDKDEEGTGGNGYYTLTPKDNERVLQYATVVNKEVFLKATRNLEALYEDEYGDPYDNPTKTPNTPSVQNAGATSNLLRYSMQSKSVSSSQPFVTFTFSYENHSKSQNRSHFTTSF